MWETCPEFIRHSARPRLELTTSRSRVRRSTATPRRHQTTIYSRSVICWNLFFFYKRTTYRLAAPIVHFYRTCICPSVKRVNVTKRKKLVPTLRPCYYIIHSHYIAEWTFILVFRHEEWLVGVCGTTPCICKFGPNWPRWSKNADFQSTFAFSASAVTRSKKLN